MCNLNFGVVQNKYQAQRALQRNGELLASKTMVGVRRLDARHKQAADTVAQSEGSRMQSAPAALTPMRKYHVSASQLVRSMASESLKLLIPVLST